MTFPTVSLRSMDEDEYRQWYDHCVVEYAKDKKMAKGISWEEALDLSRKSFESELKDGRKTPDNYFFSVIDSDDAIVGTLWIAVRTAWGKTTVFIYDIEIDPDFRRQRIGQSTMNQVEVEARRLGASEIALHVFGHNPAAKGLYDKMGYRVTDITMAKEI